jgi:hypothetical protein
LGSGEVSSCSVFLGFPFSNFFFFLIFFFSPFAFFSAYNQAGCNSQILRSFGGIENLCFLQQLQFTYYSWPDTFLYDTEDCSGTPNSHRDVASLGCVFNDANAVDDYTGTNAFVQWSRVSLVAPSHSPSHSPSQVPSPLPTSPSISDSSKDSSSSSSGVTATTFIIAVAVGGGGGLLLLACFVVVVVRYFVGTNSAAIAATSATTVEMQSVPVEAFYHLPRASAPPITHMAADQPGKPHDDPGHQYRYVPQTVASMKATDFTVNGENEANV